ncbi:TolC family protein [Helicobacter sp. MIT 14-3879]|uniref:TolC family protein n=1 Tax=Helicobacter sp. MIT 14-3879 TaxID=2040649 RepID=UPI000E1EF28B|nr:TolC family protein [Helicobacter sp. MIT 14-3879]RDU62081.1 hypothetical protein CQA44_07555 [Helicobacter sp. MIT 14-3879]
MKKYFLSLITLSSFILAQDLNIKESFNKILLNNDSLKASYSNIEKMHKLKDASYMLFAPSIDIIGNYTYIEKKNLNIDIPEVSIPNVPISSINIPPLNLEFNNNHFAFGIISIMYPIYTGGKRLSAINLAKLNIDDANFVAQLNKINLFEKLIKSYYGLKLSIEVYKTLKDIENGTKLHLENAIKLEENGQIAKLERLSAKVEYDKAKTKANQAKDAADIALLGFKTIIQDENISKNVSLDENGNILNLNLTSELKISQKNLEPLQTYQQQALSSYPAIKSIEIKKEQTKELSNIELASFMPNIGFYGGYVIKDNKTLLNKTIPSWYVGIGAKLSILSPSGRIFKYQASKIAQNEVDYLHKQAQKDILLLIESTYKEVLSAKHSFYELDSTIELAQENLKLQEEAFMNGMVNSSQVNDARNQLSFAKIESKNSQYRYIIALSKLYAISNNIENFIDFMN